MLAIVTCAIYWKFIRPLAEHRNDQPLLNRRGEKLVGQRFVLTEAIVNGRGKVSVGDGSWLAEGPELPAGSEVEVVAVDGTTLRWPWSRILLLAVRIQFQSRHVRWRGRMTSRSNRSIPRPRPFRLEREDQGKGTPEGAVGGEAADCASPLRRFADRPSLA